MRSRHVTHLLTRYLHDQLRPAQRAQVINHVRVCDSCRATLAREERLTADLRREMPALGQPAPGQLAHVWAGVWGEINTPRRRGGISGAWLPGLSLMVAALLVILVALPLLAQNEVRAEAAPLQPRPVDLTGIASPTAGVTGDAPTQDVLVSTHEDVPLTPAATVAYAMLAGVSPVPVPQATTSPEALLGFHYEP